MPLRGGHEGSCTLILAVIVAERTMVGWLIERIFQHFPVQFTALFGHPWCLCSDFC